MLCRSSGEARAMRQRAEWQPVRLHADVEHGGGGDRRKPTHAAATHGLQMHSYNGARGCRPKKSYFFFFTVC